MNPGKFLINEIEKNQGSKALCSCSLTKNNNIIYFHITNEGIMVDKDKTNQDQINKIDIYDKE